MSHSIGSAYPVSLTVLDSGYLRGRCESRRTSQGKWESRHDALGIVQVEDEDPIETAFDLLTGSDNVGFGS